jgi:hypothetical protein
MSESSSPESWLFLFMVESIMRRNAASPWPSSSDVNTVSEPCHALPASRVCSPTISCTNRFSAAYLNCFSRCHSIASPAANTAISRCAASTSSGDTSERWLSMATSSLSDSTVGAPFSGSVSTRTTSGLRFSNVQTSSRRQLREER